MKRDIQLQKDVLKKIISHEYPRMLFETYSYNGGGYEDVETPGWTIEEAHHVELLRLEGLIHQEKITDAPWLGDGRSDCYAETYIYLTPKGYDWLENRGFWRRTFANVQSNIPTVLTSVLVALFSAWLLKLTGLTQ